MKFKFVKKSYLPQFWYQATNDFTNRHYLVIAFFNLRIIFHPKEK